MKCFFHPDVEAVGVCSHCHRAVCVVHNDCARYEEHHLFCKQHNTKTIALEFSRYYIMAIDLAREAGMKGIKTADLIQDLQRRMDAEGS